MWHLSKIVGRAQLAPREMMKLYQTNPQAAKQMTALTFDKTELERLQKDLIENPKKYEDMLMKERENDPWL